MACGGGAKKSKSNKPKKSKSSKGQCTKKKNKVTISVVGGKYVYSKGGATNKKKPKVTIKNGKYVFH